MSSAPWRRAAARHEAVRLDHEAADCAVAELWLSGPHGRAIQENRGHIATEQHVGARPERPHFRVGGRDVESAGTAVRNREAAIRRHTGDEVVEQIEAPDREAEERTLLTRLDVGRQHAGRRLRGAHAHGAFVDELHRGAATSELVRHGAPDDAGADDDDVGRTGHRRHQLSSPWRKLTPALGGSS